MPSRFARNPTARVTAPSGDAFEVPLAATFASRLLGLAWLPASARGPLLIPRCRSVHTFGMRFAIDVVFIAAPGHGGGLGATPSDGIGATAPILEVRPALPPRRLASCRAPAPKEARVAALELPAGRAAELGIQPSQTLELRPARMPG